MKRNTLSKCIVQRLTFSFLPCKPRTIMPIFVIGISIRIPRLLMIRSFALIFPFVVLCELTLSPVIYPAEVTAILKRGIRVMHKFRIPTKPSSSSEL